MPSRRPIAGIFILFKGPSATPAAGLSCGAFSFYFHQIYDRVGPRGLLRLQRAFILLQEACWGILLILIGPYRWGGAQLNLILL